jgi:hypothetical protein
MRVRLHKPPVNVLSRQTRAAGLSLSLSLSLLHATNKGRREQVCRRVLSVQKLRDDLLLCHVCGHLPLHGCRSDTPRVHVDICDRCATVLPFPVWMFPRFNLVACCPKSLLVSCSFLEDSRRLELHVYPIMPVCVVDKLGTVSNWLPVSE